MVRPVSGKAGQTVAKSAASSARRASATGPMFPLIGRIEGGAVFEIDLPRARLAQPAAGRDRLLDRLADRGGARLERNHDRLGVCRHLHSIRHADDLDGAHAIAHQGVGKIGGAREVVGDAAEQDRALRHQAPAIRATA
jgi:hypothetical protein